MGPVLVSLELQLNSLLHIQYVCDTVCVSDISTTKIKTYYMFLDCPPAAFSNQLLLDGRWMLGGSSRDPSIKSMHLWSSILTMDDAKQNIFIQRVLMLHEIALKQGGRASIPRLALSDWNTLADQFCFLGHCLKHMWEKTDSSGNRMFNDALITSICKRCVEGTLD